MEVVSCFGPLFWLGEALDAGQQPKHLIILTGSFVGFQQIILFNQLFRRQIFNHVCLCFWSPLHFHADPPRGLPAVYIAPLPRHINTEENS